jgi:PAS domain S-box-containing protein
VTTKEKNIERYEKLVNDSFNEIYTFDAVSYKFIYLNTSALNNLGYTIEEIIKYTPVDIKPDYNINSFEKLVFPLRNKKKTKIQFYTNHQRKDGTLYPVEVHLQLNSKGKNQYFSAFIIDITERKLAEDTLKRSEAQFKDLFEKSSDALLIIKNGIFTDCNIATCNILGYASKNEFLNVHPSKLSPKVQPDNKNSFEKAEEMMRLTYKNGSHRFEWIHTKNNGENFPIEVLLTSISNEPNNKVIYCVWRDITKRKQAEKELKKSEDKFSKSFYNNATPMLIINLDTGERIDANESYTILTGYKISEILKGNLFINNFAYNQSHLKKLIDKAKKNEIVKDYYFQMVKKTGDVITLLANTSKLGDFSDDIIICSFIDITERDKALKQLKDSKSNLLQSQKVAKLGSYILDISNLTWTSSEILDIIFGLNKSFVRDINGWINIVHPEDREEMMMYFENNILKKHERFDKEYRIIKVNSKKECWVHGLGELDFDDAGNPTRMLGTIQDITQKKIIEKKLRISEDRFSKSFHNNATPMLIVNLETGERIDINESYSKLIGYTKKEIFKKNLYKNNLAFDQNRLKELINKAKKSVKPIYEEYLQIIKKSGEIISTLVNVSKLGNFSDDLIICSFTDITEKEKIINQLKESESRFKALHNASLGGISIHDKGVVLECNQGLCDMMGYSINEIIGMNGILLIAEQSRDFVMDKILSGTEKPYEAFGLRKNGEEFPMRLEARNVPYKGKMVRTVEFRDITESKKIEEELANYRKQLEVENVSLKEEIALSFNYEDMVYSSIEFSDVLTQVEQVSNTNATVLILGETGTGKELIAKAIHNTSDRKSKPLIRVNCAAIPTELIESELFGHKKGSFTGAINNRIGKFELANGGTLFLDEIGEMPFPLQSKLLRAIQEGEIEPIGSAKTLKLDVRIIAATNRDLKIEVEEKRFREDLYFRLNVFPIVIPPLKERIEDIPVLIDHFVNKFCKRHNKKIKFISSDILQQMKSYNWPGNVRELENLIERAVIISNEDSLIINEFNNANNKIKNTTIKDNSNTLQDIQRNHIIKILNETQWKIEGKEGAAIKLNIKPSTLRDRMKKLGIKRP